MKTTKYKLSDMAKDLKVTNNDLIECLGKLGGEPKKTQSVLTPEEISYVLEIIHRTIRWTALMLSMQIT